MYPIDWEKTFTGVSTALNALGSLATVGAFIYLFKKDNDKQAQINRLTAIASELTKMKAIDNERLNLSVRPDFRFKSMTNGTDGTLDIRIINNGEKAKLTKFELISDDLILYNEVLPYLLDKDTERKIFLRVKGSKHINESEYLLNIHYSDKINNLYIVELKGKGAQSKIMNIKLSKPTDFG